MTDVNTKPTSEMAKEAKRGLEWRSEFGRGGTEVGVSRARDISNRKNLSEKTINRMVSFFARHDFSIVKKLYFSNGLSHELSTDPCQVFKEKSLLQYFSPQATAALIMACNVSSALVISTSICKYSFTSDKSTGVLPSFCME